MVSRDGAQIYTSATEGVFPGVMQESDKFHIIKGLSETMGKYIIRTYPARIEIPSVLEENNEMKCLLNVKNYGDRVKFAHEKKKQGMTVNVIAYILHSCPKTITKYLSVDSLTVKDNVILKEEKHQLAME